MTLAPSFLRDPAIAPIWHPSFIIDSPATYDEPAVHAFIALNLIGGIGMVFVLVTCLAFRHVKRLETWYSFCFSWVLSGTAYSLLFLSGDQGNPQPIYAVCYTQAALVYALPPTYVCCTHAPLARLNISIQMQNNINDAGYLGTGTVQYEEIRRCS